MILVLRTDSPNAQIGLYDRGGRQLSHYTWHADRELANTLLQVMHERLQKIGADWHDVGGIVVFKGPGSFTGLRIGITVANTLAYALSAPIVAAQGEAWITKGLERLVKNADDRLVLPHYGTEAHITLPKK